MLIYKLAFNTWLDREHPCHDVSLFSSEHQYRVWKDELFKAYVAGIEFEQTAARAGM